MALNARELLTGSIVAATAITEFRAVDYAGNQAAAQGIAVRGISKFAQTVGNYVTIVEKGSAIMETGGAFNAGDPIICDNQGRAIKANPLAIAAGATAVTSAAANGANDITGSDTTELKIGRAITPSTAAGQFAEILLA
jgi:hypothetical protein